MTLRFDLFRGITSGKIRTIDAAIKKYPERHYDVIRAALYALQAKKKIRIEDGRLSPVPGAECPQDGRGRANHRPPRLEMMWAKTELERYWPEPQRLRRDDLTLVEGAR